MFVRHFRHQLVEYSNAFMLGFTDGESSDCIAIETDFAASPR